MKLGFMSSVCPKMSLAELISAAQTYGYKGIEFRVQWQHGHGVELETSYAELQSKRRQLADAGIEASCLATGVRFCDDDARTRNDLELELKKMIDLAVALGTDRLRIFGDTVPESPSARSANLARQREHLAPLAGTAQAAGVTLCLETHGNLTGTDVAEVIEPIDSVALRALWHPLHPLRHSEPVATTWEKIGKRLDHCHFSVDEFATPEQNRECFTLLKQARYHGYQSVEVINPPDSIAVLKEYADYFKQFAA